MPAQDWLKEFQECRLCAWNCGVDRLRGERGVCGLGLPRIAHATLHPAPPASYTIFMAGCNFRCLFCQNWTISTYPIQNVCRAERADPEQAALVALEHLRSPYASLMGADRIFFSGGSPTPSFPFVEALVRAARKREPHTKVNYDTNGFMAEGTFERMIAMADSVTFDIRAVSDDVHRAMTGAPSGPVLANARRMARHPEKLWEFRVLVVPGFNTGEIPGICSFIAGLNPDLPVCFLAFRPNFYLEELRGATVQEMEEAVRTARECGLRNVTWSGRPGIPGKPPRPHMAATVDLPCPQRPRTCGGCPLLPSCPISLYHPSRTT